MTPAPHDPPDRYAVLGHPVAHSRSPFIHAAFALQTGERLVYGREWVPLDGFAAAVRAFAAAGGRGCNVTVPFKFETPALAARTTPRAALAMAGNVLRFDAPEAGGWITDNTDGIGLVRDLERHGGAPTGRRVLLIGAGGAAAGVLGPLLEARPAALRLVNRSFVRAEALAARHAAHAAAHGVRLEVRGLADPGPAWDLVINASATSLEGAPVPVPGSVLAPGALAVDLMYGPAAAPFLAWAEAHGARARDGLGMLVEQAAEAFHFWRGVRPETPPVLDALREHVAAGLP
jgi:shikimate dehydrogenase